MSLNKVMLIGNVGADPDIRYLDRNASDSAKVASLRLATTEKYRDRSGELRESTEWHNVVAWRNLADIIEKYVKKGSQIYVEGRLRTRSWEDQNNNKRYTTEIVADTLQLLGRKSDNQNAQGGYQSQYDGGQQNQSGYQQGGYQRNTNYRNQGGYQQQGGYQSAHPQNYQAQNQPQSTPPQVPPVQEEDDDLPF